MWEYRQNMADKLTKVSYKSDFYVNQFKIAKVFTLRSRVPFMLNA